MSLFLVDAHAAGIVIQGFPTIDGQRAAEIELHEVQVPAEALLAGLGAGFEPLEWAVDRAIAALCAEAVGAMEKLLELTAEHLRTRKQFGQPIGRFQALQHRIADMAVAVEQSRSMALLAAATHRGAGSRRTAPRDFGGKGHDRPLGPLRRAAGGAAARRHGHDR